MAFKHYLEDENDKPYFTTNSLAYYYDKMEGFAEKVEQAAKILNVTKEEVDKRITLYIEQNKNELDQRLADWDRKLETFDSSVETLLAEWVDDGTLSQVIDSTLIDQKIAPVTAQLEETAGIASITKERGNQKNFLEFHDRNSSNSFSNSYNVLSDRSLMLKIGLGEGETFDVELRKNALDDLIKFRTGSFNTFQETLVKADYADANVTNGTMSGSTTENPYATVPGVTITQTFTGSELYFNHFTDNRGGLWEFNIDGAVVGNISTHVNAVSASELIQSFIAKRVVTTSLSAGEHTLVMTFKGDDPNNLPTGGAGTSRGWTRRNTGSSSNPAYNLETFEYVAKALSKVEAISDSNKEFAFSAKETGATYPAQWFPEHNSIGTALKGSTGYQEFYVDGVLTSLTDTATNKPFKEIKLVQKLEFIHPDATGALGVLLMTTTVNHKGASYSSKMKWLKNVDVPSGYVNMLTVNTDFGTELISSMGGKYPLDKVDGSQIFIEENAPLGFAVVSSKFPNHYLYMQSFSETDLRLDESGRYGEADGKKFYFLQYRNARLQKLYPVVYSGHVAKAGDVYRYDGHFGFGKHPRISELLG